LALEFNRVTYDGIRKLAANPCPECELEKMSSFELELLDEQIDKIANADGEDEKLFAKLMRLKSHASLVGEYAKKKTKTKGDEKVMKPKTDEDYLKCTKCENILPHCHCKCPYCGERDKCECALFDAATGG